MVVLKVLRLLGQQAVAVRDSGVVEKKKIFDWVFTITKLRTGNCRISVVQIPVPQSLSWQLLTDHEA